MKPHTPNPYADASLDELDKAAQQAANDIEHRDARSPDERAELAARCRHLLLAMARRIGPGLHMPHEPEYRLDLQGRFVDAFADWAEHHAKGQRYLAMRRAQDWVTRQTGIPARQLPAGYETPEALRESLEAMQTVMDEAKG